MLLELLCGYQQYDWGKLGTTSAVARFAAASEPSLRVEDAEPYAELWMGTHPKQPSVIAHASKEKETLRDVIEQHPEALGSKVVSEFGAGELPFLFKVLSIRKALSIQAHPDKTLAKQLYSKDPKNYPDDNHKPEMAIALTDFEGFCGFRPLDEIASFLKHVPEFAELVGKKVADEFTNSYKKEPERSLKTLFEAVMTAPDATVNELSSRVAKSAKDRPDTFAGAHGGQELADLIVRVNSQFPGDVGVFCGGLMLNYCKLQQGEAMFLRAKDPHAYISGDIIECMAASDNVVRAGFTPKFKDVPTLVNMLTYACAPVSEQKMKPTTFPASVTSGKALLFDPPIDEFAVLQQTTPAATASTIKALSGPSIFIVTEGSGKVTSDGKTHEYHVGSVFFVGANTEVKLEATKATESYHAIAGLD